MDTNYHVDAYFRGTSWEFCSQMDKEQAQRTVNRYLADERVTSIHIHSYHKTGEHHEYNVDEFLTL